MAKSKKVKIELNDAGIQALLKGEEVQELLNEIANEGIASLGDGYSKNERVVGRRRIVEVVAETPEAIRDCYENNTLTKVFKAVWK